MVTFAKHRKQLKVLLIFTSLFIFSLHLLGGRVRKKKVGESRKGSSKKRKGKSEKLDKMKIEGLFQLTFHMLFGKKTQPLYTVFPLLPHLPSSCPTMPPPTFSCEGLCRQKGDRGTPLYISPGACVKLLLLFVILGKHISLCFLFAKMGKLPILKSVLEEQKINTHSPFP